MIHVKYNSGSLKKEEALYLPVLSIYEEQYKYVVSITVDEEELQHIKQCFGFFNTVGSQWTMNIPWNYNSKSQTWYGDLARTILANL